MDRKSLGLPARVGVPAETATVAINPAAANKDMRVSCFIDVSEWSLVPLLGDLPRPKPAS